MKMKNRNPLVIFRGEAMLYREAMNSIYKENNLKGKERLAVVLTDKEKGQIEVSLLNGKDYILPFANEE